MKYEELLAIAERVRERSKVAAFALPVIVCACGWVGRLNPHAGQCPKCRGYEKHHNATHELILGNAQWARDAVAQVEAEEARR